MENEELDHVTVELTHYSTHFRLSQELDFRWNLWRCSNVLMFYITAVTIWCFKGDGFLEIQVHGWKSTGTWMRDGKRSLLLLGEERTPKESFSESFSFALFQHLFGMKEFTNNINENHQDHISLKHYFSVILMCKMQLSGNISDKTLLLPLSHPFIRVLFFTFGLKGLETSRCEQIWVQFRLSWAEEPKRRIPWKLKLLYNTHRRSEVVFNIITK